MTKSTTRVGVYVDSANLTRNGGRKLNYGILRQFACRGGAEPLRLNAYVTFDADRAEADAVYREGQRNFQSAVRDCGFKVIEKRVKWYTDELGKQFAKANADLDLAVDALLQSENLDRVLLATGDGDFVQVVRALQNRGCRVEVIAFDNVSNELRREADLFISGYLIPGLLPVGRSTDAPWGEVGSYVRGVCYSHPDSRDFGFMRFLRSIDGQIWNTDTREEDSPFRSAFFHDTMLPRDVTRNDVPSRNIIFEFELVESAGRAGEFQARNISVVSPSRRVQSTLDPRNDLRAEPSVEGNSHSHHVQINVEAPSYSPAQISGT